MTTNYLSVFCRFRSFQHKNLFEDHKLHQVVDRKEIIHVLNYTQITVYENNMF